MSIKVLVADDSITIQKVIGIIFGGDEYSLTVVDNGKAAVDKALEIIPDILLIDALMPGMSGYEVAELVRATPSIAAKPILILTGSFEPFDEEKARKCGADDFIAKPFESQQIISKVKELLELGSAREPSALDLSSPIPVPEPVREQTPAASPADIWGAFTQEAEHESAAPVIAVTPDETSDLDVFAIVNEENDAQLLQSSTVTDTSFSHPGSQWLPVEESTFEFQETIAAPPQSTFAEEGTPLDEPSFGDIAFEDEAPFPAAPAYTVPEEPALTDPAPYFVDLSATPPAFAAPASPAKPFAPLPDPTPVFFEASAPAETAPAVSVTSGTSDVTDATAAISEEQLKTALASVSKDVIERIVWEVVPDLAEAMIREAIRKIKEGV